MRLTAAFTSAYLVAASGAMVHAQHAGGRPGIAMQVAAGTPVTKTGCLLFKEGRFIIHNSNTQEVVELIGLDLALNLGNRVEITGSVGRARPGVSIATGAVNVTTVSPVAQGGCLTVASLLGATDVVPGDAARGSAAPPSSNAQPQRQPEKKSSSRQ